MPQNCEYWSCGDRDKTINQIMCECCKFVQKYYKTKHNWLGKETRWELWEKSKFDHTNKWYLHNLESVWDFEKQTDYLISTRQPDLVTVYKKKKTRTWWIVVFVVPTDQRVKLKECEKRDKYIDLARELKKNYGTWRCR